MSNIRFVLRDGMRILQQQMLRADAQQMPETYWVDVPLIDESSGELIENTQTVLNHLHGRVAQAGRPYDSATAPSVTPPTGVASALHRQPPTVKETCSPDERSAPLNPTYDAGMKTTPGMWQMVSDLLHGEALPNSINAAIKALCDGEAILVAKPRVLVE